MSERRPWYDRPYIVWPLLPFAILAVFILFIVVFLVTLCSEVWKTLQTWFGFQKEKHSYGEE